MFGVYGLIRIIRVIKIIRILMTIMRTANNLDIRIIHGNTCALRKITSGSSGKVVWVTRGGTWYCLA